jgi:hypothetical protein
MEIREKWLKMGNFPAVAARAANEKAAVVDRESRLWRCIDVDIL